MELSEYTDKLFCRLLENLEVTVRVEQDVGRFEVSVEHVGRVDVLQPSEVR